MTKSTFGLVLMLLGGIGCAVAPAENAESSLGAVSDTTATEKKGSSDGAVPAKGASCDPGPVLPKTDAKGDPKTDPKVVPKSDPKSDPKVGSQIGPRRGPQSGSQIGPVRLRAGGHRSRYE